MENTIKASYDSTEIEEIINFLKAGERQITYSTQNDIILLLGLTASGKSTFAQFVTGYDNELTSVLENNSTDIIKPSDIEIDEQRQSSKKNELYKIVDKRGKIGNSSVDSKTTIPDLIIDTENNIALYDCPGFSDTRTVAYEISETYFVKKIIDFAKRVKLVFTIDSTPIERLESTSSKKLFSAFIRHAVEMVKNIKKFKDSIALIVTKVDTVYTDESYIEKIVIVGLNRRINDMKISTNPKEHSKEVMDFMDILLENTKKNRIGIFRRPTIEGNVTKINSLYRHKQALRDVIYKNIKYTAVEENDFGYTLSNGAQKHVKHLIEKITNDIASHIQEIGQKIKQYYQSQEKKLKDIENLRSKMRLGYNTFKATRDSEIKEPEQLITYIHRNMTNLNVTISQTDFPFIENNIEYITFLKSISSEVIETRASHLSWELKDLVEYLSDSQNWYSFLIEFKESLSKYAIQKNVSEHEKEIIALKNSIYLDANLSDQYKIVERIKTLSDIDYETAQLLDKNKLMFLNDILNLTLSSKKINYSCTENTLVIQGENVKLSDIFKTDCPQSKSIKIYALNKVFIDADLQRIGDQLQLSIIAPTWEVIGEKKIILDGKPGKPHVDDKVKSPPGPGSDGYNGEPGNSGGDTGNFLGIGLKFINGEHLSISLKGGDGAPGQHGSDGTKGKDGELIDDPKNSTISCTDYFGKGCFFRNRYFLPTDLFYFRSTVDFICERYGSYCTKGGNGGKGGKGGEGGKAKEMFFFSLENNQIPNLKFHHVDGKNGRDGTQGANQPDGRKGQNLKILCEEVFDSSRYPHVYTYVYHVNNEDYVKRNHSYCEPAIKAPAPQQSNDKSINDPIKLDDFKPITVINEYKSFLRKNLHNNMRETYLREFLERLENRVDLEDLSNTLGFVNELQSLEDQFYELHINLPLLPFYESLLLRLTKYIDKIDKNGKLQIADRKALNYLYTAIYTKIISINYHNANNLILDLGKYLDDGIRDINKLNIFAQITLIENLNENYQYSIEKQIERATGFVGTKIKPKLNEILQQVDADLQVLIDDAVFQKNTAKQEENELFEKNAKLRMQLELTSVLNIVDMASQFLSFLGPIGKAAGVAMSGGVQIIEALVIDKNMVLTTNERLMQLPGVVKNLLPSIRGEFEKKQNSLKRHLTLAKKQLNENPHDKESKTESDILKEIEDKISEVQKEIDEQTDEELSYDKSIQKQKELKNYLIQKKKQVANDKVLESRMKNVIKILDRTQTVLSMVDVPIKLYEKLSKDERKIDEMGLAIKKAGNKLESLKEYENNIYQKIIPACRLINNRVKNLSFNKTQSHADLDISKWEIQSVLSNLREQIQKLTKEFSSQQTISSLLEKLELGISEMISMYKLVQDYHDKQELAKYIANINSNTALQIQIPNVELSQSINRLKLIIQSNIVLAKYEQAMNSFRQLIYPFANFYEPKDKIPYAIQSNDIQDVKVTTVDAMIRLKSEVASDSWDIKGRDFVVWKNLFSHHNRNPFFTWTHDENMRAISELLNGTEITLKSDITKGLTNRNAVKFNSVGIFFKLANRSLQDDFYGKLKHFSISMEHLGNSQYRCDNRFHVITTNNVIIKYKLGQHSGNQFEEYNRVYGKLNKNKPILSPYTMWNIKLTEMEGYTFDLLAKYQHVKMDLVLEGTGESMDPRANIKNIPVCSEDLNKYYKVDDTISPVENIALSDKKEKSEIKSPTELPTSAQKQRIRRSLNEHEWKRDMDNQLFATNGAYSSMKSSFINSIFNAIGAGLVTFDHLNLVNKISQWFNKRGKSIDQDFNMLDNDDPLILKFSNVLLPGTKMPEVSNIFINDKSTPINNAIYDFSVCNHGNLLLLDLIIRSKSGVKHKQGNFMISKKMGSEYAQSLAYRAHVPQ